MCYLDPWDSCVFGEGWMVDDGEIRDGVMVLVFEIGGIICICVYG